MSQHKNSFLAISFLIFILLFLSCSKGGDADASSDSDTVGGLPQIDSADLISDTVKTDSVVEPPVMSFPTSEAALNYMQKSGHWDQYSNGILPRMAKENLPYCSKLLNNQYKRFIVVDKRRMKVILYNKYGEVEKSYGMACGKRYGTKHKKADSRTPEGFFSASGIYDSRDWKFTDDNGVTHPEKGVFGPRFIRLKTPVTSQIGIHGAGTSRTLGKRVSHGCIRLTNDAIMELVELVEIGMPIIVSPGEQDMIVNIREGYDVPFVTTGAGEPMDKEDLEKREAARKEKEAQARLDSIRNAEEAALQAEKELIDSAVSEPLVPAQESEVVTDSVSF